MQVLFQQAAEFTQSKVLAHTPPLATWLLQKLVELQKSPFKHSWSPVQAASLAAPVQALFVQFLTTTQSSAFSQSSPGNLYKFNYLLYEVLLPCPYWWSGFFWAWNVKICISHNGIFWNKALPTSFVSTSI